MQKVFWSNCVLAALFILISPIKSCIRNIQGCSRLMKVDWLDLPPYIYALNGTSNDTKSQTINGTLKTIIEEMVRKCCGKCVQFEYMDPSRNFGEIVETLNSLKGISDLTYPIYGKYTDTKFNFYPYYPIIETPGVIFLRNKLKDQTATQTIASVVTSGWPIAVLCLVLAALAGIVINIFDSHWNPAHFPSPFYKGSWEGFWWAFVTMTTVGYGDRAPRSFHARTFSFFWALLGLTVLGLFTSIVSSALTSFSLSKDIELYGKKIVVMNQTEEHRYAEKNNAQVIVVKTIEEFLEKLESSTEDVDGSLIDSYLAGHYKKQLSAIPGIEFSKVFDYQFTYGFVLPMTSGDLRLQKCLYKAINETRITQFILDEFHALPETKIDTSTLVSKGLINSESDIFLTVLYICLGSIVFLLITGVAWEYFYSLPKRRNEKNTVKELTRACTLSAKDSFLHVCCTQCREIEDVIVGEVTTFYEKFMNRIDEVNSTIVKGS